MLIFILCLVIIILAICLYRERRNFNSLMGIKEMLADEIDRLRPGGKDG